MLKRLILVGTLVIACLAGLSSTSWAWGRQGHRIVARIAAKSIDAPTRSKIAAIFGTADTVSAVESAMADASVWPDQIDKVATGTREWHFINASVSTPFSAAGLCSAHNCVIDRIEEMQTRLRNNQKGFKLLTAPMPNRPMLSREVAFLIHFVGDIHQPLHAATNSDFGGVGVHLTVPIQHGQFATMNLHAVWDDDEVFEVLNVLGNETQTAQVLFQRIQNGAMVTQASPVDWAHESNDLAKQDVYGKLSIANHKVTVTQAYLQSNEADVERQLMRAGIRLARLLNDMCQGTGCKAKP
jgi:hypothetical protein